MVATYLDLRVVHTVKVHGLTDGPTVTVGPGDIREAGVHCWRLCCRWSSGEVLLSLVQLHLDLISLCLDGEHMRSGSSNGFLSGSECLTLL